uniref:Uncharacterized protein n=1 Tax=Glossina morsitans morsitans TaxID=37546 RepID=A0A1B0FHP9_GLOMM
MAAFIAKQMVGNQLSAVKVKWHRPVVRYKSITAANYIQSKWRPYDDVYIDRNNQELSWAHSLVIDENRLSEVLCWCALTGIQLSPFEIEHRNDHRQQENIENKSCELWRMNL